MHEASTTWAVVVGIEHYLDFPPAPGAVAGAEAAVRWLKRLGVPDAQIRLLVSRPDADPISVTDLEDCFDGLLNVSGTRLFIFLSGHGAYQKDHHLFLAQDVKSEMMGRHLDVDAYLAWLSTLDFKRRFLFMDTGFDRTDALTTPRAVPWDVPPPLHPEQESGIVACFAAAPGQRSYVADGESLFIRHLLAGLDPEHPPPDTIFLDPSTGTRSVDLFQVMRRHVIPSVEAETSKLGGSAQRPSFVAMGPAQLLERCGIFTLLDDALGGWLTGYDSDAVGQTDLLGIGRDVDPLAALLASTKISPPLSVGLFGDWGSGKSFFMRQLDHRVAQLAESARRSEETRPDSERYYGSQIVQIWFNAWHYAEANLWASLASRIFEGLADHLRVEASGTSAYRQVLGLMSGLEQAQTQLQQTEQRRDALQAALEDGDGEQVTDPGQQDLGVFGEQHQELNAQLDVLVDTAGADQATTDVRQALDAAQDIRRVGRRIRIGWGALDKDRDRWWSSTKLRALLAGALLVGLVLSVWLLGHNADVAAAVSFLVPVLGAAAAAAKVLLDTTRKALQAIERVLDDERRSELKATQEAVDAQQARVSQLRAEIDALDPLEQSSLYRFISERYASKDYREYLGIVALIQRDLETLSKQLVKQPGSAKQDDKPLLKVERIILYVDDLDRCPPKQVVQVLQAVHLLLAFPLFVAVVGVDSRWLVRSLQREYADMLTSEGSGRTVDDAGEYWVSTPQQYLEKIFQIPLWLRPMKEQGFSQLVRGLLRERDNHGVTQGEADGGTISQPADKAGGSQQGEAAHQDGGSATTGPHEPGPTAPDDTWPRQQPPLAGPGEDVAPRTLVITEPEQRFLELLSPFVTTPRSAKRLVNLYRLIKVSAGERRMAAFEGRPGQPGEHQAAMLLLAIVIGFPMQAPTLFQMLEQTDIESWPVFIDRLRPRQTNEDATEFHSALAGTMTPAEAAPWQELCRALDASSERFGELATVDDLAVFKKWLEPVGRYSFGVGRILSGA